MNTQRFELDCSRLNVEAMRSAKSQVGEDAHLFVNSGFLDDSAFHRTLMLYGQNYSGGAMMNHEPPRFAPGGKMLAFNETHVFGFARLPHLHRWVRELEWHIYRASKTDRKRDPPWGKEGRIIDLSAHDPIIHADVTDPEKRTRLKKSLLSSTIKYDWSQHDPNLYVNSIVLTEKLLYIAGPPAVRNEATGGRSKDGKANEVELCGVSPRKTERRCLNCRFHHRPFSKGCLLRTGNSLCFSRQRS